MDFGGISFFIDFSIVFGSQHHHNSMILENGKPSLYIVNNGSVAHCTLLQKKMLCATDTLFVMFSADSVVRGSWPGHPFWDTWATFGLTCPTFYPFWGEKLVVRSTPF